MKNTQEDEYKDVYLMLFTCRLCNTNLYVAYNLKLLKIWRELCPVAACIHLIWCNIDKYHSFSNGTLRTF